MLLRAQASLLEHQSAKQNTDKKEINERTRLRPAMSGAQTRIDDSQLEACRFTASKAEEKEPTKRRILRQHKGGRVET